MPYQDYILLIKGDLINEKGKYNNNYIDNSTDLFVINEILELTIRIYGYQSNIILNIEEYNSDDVIIIDENHKTENVFSHKYNNEECNQDKMKYIIYKFDINHYLYKKNTLSKYLTTDNQAEMYIL